MKFASPVVDTLLRRQRLQNRLFLNLALMKKQEILTSANILLNQIKYCFVNNRNPC